MKNDMEKIYAFLFFSLGFTWFFAVDLSLLLFSLFCVLYYIDIIVIKSNYPKKYNSSYEGSAPDFLKRAVLLFWVLFAQMTLAQLLSVIRPVHDALHYVPGFSLWLKNAAKLGANIFFSYTLFRFFQRNFADGSVFRFFALGNLFFSIVTLILAVFFPSGFSVWLVRWMGVLDVSTLHNPLGWKLVQCVYLVLLSMQYAKAPFSRVLHVIYIIIGVIATAFTFSRASLLALTGSFLFIFFFNAKRAIFAMWGVLLLLSSFVFLGNVFQNWIPEEFADRYSFERAVTDKGSGRIDVWMDYFEHAALENWVAGGGYNSRYTVSILDQKPLRIARNSEVDLKKINAGLYGGIPDRMHSPHNTYIDLFLSFGVLGFGWLIFFAWLFCRLLRDALRKKYSVIYAGLLAAILIHFFFELDFTSHRVHMLFAVLLARIFTEKGNEDLEV